MGKKNQSINLLGIALLAVTALTLESVIFIEGFLIALLGMDLIR